MYDKIVKQLLEDFNVYPRAKAPMSQGPNINFTGPNPSGFLGGGLPGINPSANQLVLKPKLKKKKIKKKRAR